MHEPLVRRGANLREIHVDEASRNRWLRRLHSDRAGSVGQGASHIPYGVLQFLPRRPADRNARVSRSTSITFFGSAYVNI